MKSRVKKYTSIYILVNTIGDMLILNFGYAIGILLSLNSEYKTILDPKYFTFWLFLNVNYLIAAHFSNTFNIFRNTKFYDLVGALFKLFIIQILLNFAYIVTFKDFFATFKLSRQVIFINFLIAVPLTTFWRFGFIKIARFYRARGHNNRNLMILGASESAQRFREMLEHRLEFGYAFFGYFDDNPKQYPNYVQKEIKGNLEDAKVYIQRNMVEELFIAIPKDENHTIQEFIELAEDNLTRVKIIPDFSGYLPTSFNKVDIDYYGSVPVLTIREEPLESFINQIIKRVFDIVFSISFLFVFTLFIFPIVALLIKLGSKGPVLFKQKRSGVRNQAFTVYKFRTMYVNDESDTKQATKGDSRVTPIGKILRKYNIDEMPQFYNVLLGDMSIVGPRPHMLKHTEEYSKIVDKFMVRHLIKPGITGLAQVSGYRGETKDPKDMENRVLKDVEYLESWSLKLDIEIIFKTIFSTFGDKNAY
ncbi:MAG: undecaprenyl-phosphate glucose phosphotransferase [Chitinophagales bacterium]|nr:undecaprenyl-phosphate glucose phosphotransferase [Chitinophagales bacterium]